MGFCVFQFFRISIFFLWVHFTQGVVEWHPVVSMIRNGTFHYSKGQRVLSDFFFVLHAFDLWAIMRSLRYFFVVFSPMETFNPDSMTFLGNRDDKGVHPSRHWGVPYVVWNIEEGLGSCVLNIEVVIWISVQAPQFFRVINDFLISFLCKYLDSDHLIKNLGYIFRNFTEKKTFFRDMLGWGNHGWNHF